MKRLALAVALVALFVTAGHAELGFTRVSASDTSQSVTINAATLQVVNDGSNEVYVRVFWQGETSAAATTAYAEIKSGEGFTFVRAAQIASISLICATGETATVRLFYW